MCKGRKSTSVIIPLLSFLQGYHHRYMLNETEVRNKNIHIKQLQRTIYLSGSSFASTSQTTIKKRTWKIFCGIFPRRFFADIYISFHILISKWEGEHIKLQKKVYNVLSFYFQVYIIWHYTILVDDDDDMDTQHCVSNFKMFKSSW